MLTFRIHPAAISVTEGVQHAFTYLGSSWRSWLPVVVALALIDLVCFLFIAENLRNLYYLDRYTSEIVWAPDLADRAWRIAPFIVLLAVASLVGGWVFAGIAIAGLRGWKLTAAVVLRRGGAVLISSLIIAVVTFAGILAVAILIVLSPPVGILVAIAAVFVALYAWIRITFYTLAIFDGFGPLGGLQESWRLSKGAVLRMAGWGFMAGLISLGFAMMGGMASGPMAGSDTISVAIAQGISGGLGAAASVFSIFLMAVLYESQRARNDPSLYPVAAYPPAYPPPGYPGAVPPWAVPPGAYPPGAYPPYPYPYAQPPAQPQAPADAPPGWPPQGS